MRQALLTLVAEMAAKDELLARERREVAFKQALIDKLTHELAILRRLKYAVTSEKFCAGMRTTLHRETVINSPSPARHMHA